MSEDEEEEGSVPGDLFDLDQALVLTADGSTNFEYPLCFISAFEPARSMECVVITRVDAKLLVAVPEEAWHKKKDKRVMQPHASPKQLE